MIHQIIKDKSTRLFIILGGFFIANALIAEIIGVKIFSLEKTLGLSPMDIKLFGNVLSVNLTAGVLLWPVVFIMTDIIKEYYGMKGVRFLSYLTAGLIVFAFLVFCGAMQLAPADFFIRHTHSMKTSFHVYCLSENERHQFQNQLGNLTSFQSHISVSALFLPSLSTSSKGGSI